jgi:succinyl-diaminopimelate desuccinylase
MLNKILHLSQKLIKIQSDPDKPEELSQALNLCLQEFDDKFTIEKFNYKASKSALIHNQKTGHQEFKIILNCHLDVIPGKKSQYIPKIIDNKLFGVGAMDMKANAVAAILAFQEIATKTNTPLALQLVTDEEIGGFLGTKHQIDSGIRAEFVLATEPTNFNIVNQAKGVLWLKISCQGQTAHGAYPWRGENAIWKMCDFLTTLRKKFPILSEAAWKSSLNLASIESPNKAPNKIPDHCTVTLDIRFIPKDSKKIMTQIQKILPKDFEIEILANESALFTDENNHFIQSLKKITEKELNQEITCYGANGSSDARHFTAIGGHGIEFGPIGDGIGSDQEWVDIPSLEQYYRIICDFLKTHSA